jgi:hypothetical protein
MFHYNNIIVLSLIGIAFYLFYKYELNKKKSENIFVASDFKLKYDKDEYNHDDKMELYPKCNKINKHHKTKKFDYNDTGNGKHGYTAYNGKKYPYKIDLNVDPDEEVVPNQYHPDYTSVVEYLNSRMKPTIFNVAFLPVVMKFDGEKKDVFAVVNRFVFELSRKTKMSLKILDIVKVRKSVIENQEKYQCDIILQKETPLPSKIKMIIRMSYVYNTDDTIDEDDFFEQAWTNKLVKQPILDETFIIGYTPNYYDIESQAQTEYYAFKDVDQENFMDEQDIDKIVKGVRRKHAMENGCVNTTWDEDGRALLNNGKYEAKYEVDTSLCSSNWGNTNRRNEKSAYTKNVYTDNLYPSIGTSMLDV